MQLPSHPSKLASQSAPVPSLGNSPSLQSSASSSLVDHNNNINELKRVADSSHYDSSTSSAPKRPFQEQAPSEKPVHDDPYSSALSQINDTEQLQFLALQLNRSESQPSSAAPQSSSSQPPSTATKDPNRLQSLPLHQQQQASQLSSYQPTQRSQSPIHSDLELLRQAATSDHILQYANNQLESNQIQENTNSFIASTPFFHSNNLPITAPAQNGIDYTAYQLQDPITNLRVRSIPILDNLATQILNTLTKPGHLDSLGIATSPETAEGQAFQVLISLFTQTKTIYCDTEFINATEIGLDKEPFCRQVIQKANLATFVAALFGVYPMSFYLLDYHFLDTFVHPGSRLLKFQAALYLDLKTQAYIVTVQQRDDPREFVLNHTFPDNIADLLLARRHADTLAPSESDFVQRVKRRKEHLSALPLDTDLSQKYRWLTFIRDIADYVNKNLNVILTGKAAKSSSAGSQATKAESIGTRRRYVEKPRDDDGHIKSHSLSMMIDNNVNNTTNHEDTPDSNNEYDSQEDFNRNKNGSHNAAENSSKQSIQDRTEMQQQQQQQQPQQQQQQQAQPQQPFASFTPPTRPPFSQRHPWSAAEEAALLKGLALVKGPFWSQILELYGPGGSLSEVLKDRNQVQLKDKARNLKIYYLKTNTPMPEVLKDVTGDVRSRGAGVKRTRRGRATPGPTPVANIPASTSSAAPSNSTTMPVNTSNSLPSSTIIAASSNPVISNGVLPNMDASLDNGIQHTPPPTKAPAKVTRKKSTKPATPQPAQPPVQNSPLQPTQSTQPSGFSQNLHPPLTQQSSLPPSTQSQNQASASASVLPNQNTLKPTNNLGLSNNPTESTSNKPSEDAQPPKISGTEKQNIPVSTLPQGSAPLTATAPTPATTTITGSSPIPALSLPATQKPNSLEPTPSTSILTSDITGTAAPRPVPAKSSDAMLSKPPETTITSHDSTLVPAIAKPSEIELPDTSKNKSLQPSSEIITSSQSSMDDTLTLDSLIQQVDAYINNESNGNSDNTKSKQPVDAEIINLTESATASSESKAEDNTSKSDKLHNDDDDDEDDEDDDAAARIKELDGLLGESHVSDDEDSTRPQETDILRRFEHVLEREIQMEKEAEKQDQNEEKSDVPPADDDLEADRRAEAEIETETQQLLSRIMGQQQAEQDEPEVIAESRSAASTQAENLSERVSEVMNNNEEDGSILDVSDALKAVRDAIMSETQDSTKNKDAEKNTSGDIEMVDSRKD